MKSLMTGMAGALLVLGSFVAGAIWQGKTVSVQVKREPSWHYEMHVMNDGSVVRFDRVTGRAHMDAANSAGLFGEPWPPIQSDSHAAALAEQER
jgi:hypothetical protein